MSGKAFWSAHVVGFSRCLPTFRRDADRSVRQLTNGAGPMYQNRPFGKFSRDHVMADGLRRAGGIFLLSRHARRPLVFTRSALLPRHVRVEYKRHFRRSLPDSCTV